MRYGTAERFRVHQEEEQAFFAKVRRYRGTWIGLVDDQSPPEWSLRAKLVHPERLRAFLQARMTAHIDFFRDVERRRAAAVVAPCATLPWARRMFPELDDDEALRRLWWLLFELTHADRDDAGELLAAEAGEKQTRIRMLDELAVRELHVVGGGVDLRVPLSPKARWTGSQQRTNWGQTFHLNFPSWEIFTTPDWRGVEGRLVASRPFRVAGGATVRDLVMDFADGQMKAFEASTGREELAHLLEIDAGARRLGEFALVGEDSPIGRRGLVFGQLHLDENAVSHVALGQSLAAGLEDGETLSEPELEELGCNDSDVHLDILFGSPSVSVVATKSREGEVTLLEGGRWTDRFRLTPRVSERP